jgi:uncharacterized membrane protein (UPF0127 family)
MRTLIWQSFEEQARGLQHRPKIEHDMLFVFPYIVAHDTFHSRNVVAQFDIAYLAEDMTVLGSRTMTPPHDLDQAPKGTYMAVEAAAGNLRRWGFEVGRRVSF